MRKTMHHLLLENISSKHMVSVDLVSSSVNIIAISPSLMYAFPPPFEFLSPLSSGYWYMPIYARNPSSFVSYTQKISIGYF